MREGNTANLLVVGLSGILTGAVLLIVSYFLIDQVINITPWYEYNRVLLVGGVCTCDSIVAALHIVGLGLIIGGVILVVQSVLTLGDVGGSR